MSEKEIRPRIVERTAQAIEVMLDRGGDNWLMARETLVNPELALSVDEMREIESKVVEDQKHKWFFDGLKKEAGLKDDYTPDHQVMN